MTTNQPTNRSIKPQPRRPPGHARQGTHTHTYNPNPPFPPKKGRKGAGQRDDASICPSLPYTPRHGPPIIQPSSLTSNVNNNNNKQQTTTGVGPREYAPGGAAGGQGQGGGARRGKRRPSLAHSLARPSHAYIHIHAPAYAPPPSLLSSFPSSRDSAHTASRNNASPLTRTKPHQRSLPLAHPHQPHRWWIRQPTTNKQTNRPAEPSPPRPTRSPLTWPRRPRPATSPPPGATGRWRRRSGRGWRRSR